ncbi:MAG: CAP domain-containing protein [Rhodospirillales bacterium]|nr:CAP domain-containing protein [Rhodospirillales bacterium]
MTCIGFRSCRVHAVSALAVVSVVVSVWGAGAKRAVAGDPFVERAAKSGEFTPRGDGKDEVRRLYAKLVDPVTADAEATDVARSLIEEGEIGARLAFAHLRPRVIRERNGYLTQFKSEARKALLDGRDAVDAEKHVAALRKTVLDVAASGNLSKEIIKAKSDPALDELREMLLIDRDEVLASSDKLVARRKMVLELNDLAGKAYAAMNEQTKKRERAEPPADRENVEAALRTKEKLYAQLATPIPGRDRKTLEANIKLAEEIDAEEARGIAHVNEIRLLLGLRTLRIDPKLCDASRDHSKDMAEKGFFAHDSPVPGKTTPWQRAKNFGTSARAENIYMGSTDPIAPVRGWWYSPGHHKNMLNPSHSRIGHGHYEKRWTQMFG